MYLFLRYCNTSVPLDPMYNRRCAKAGRNMDYAKGHEFGESREGMLRRLFGRHVEIDKRWSVPPRHGLREIRFHRLMISKRTDGLCPGKNMVYAILV